MKAYICIAKFVFPRIALFARSSVPWCHIVLPISCVSVLDAHPFNVLIHVKCEWDGWSVTIDHWSPLFLVTLAD